MFFTSLSCIDMSVLDVENTRFPSYFCDVCFVSLIEGDSWMLGYLCVFALCLLNRPSMSQGTVMIQTQSRQFEKDFTVATPEEFVHRFGGTHVINKVLCNFIYGSVCSWWEKNSEEKLETGSGMNYSWINEEETLSRQNLVAGFLMQSFDCKVGEVWKGWHWEYDEHSRIDFVDFFLLLLSVTKSFRSSPTFFM